MVSTRKAHGRVTSEKAFELGATVLYSIALNRPLADGAIKTLSPDMFAPELRELATGLFGGIHHPAMEVRLAVPPAMREAVMDAPLEVDEFDMLCEVFKRQWYNDTLNEIAQKCQMEIGMGGDAAEAAYKMAEALQVLERGAVQAKDEKQEDLTRARHFLESFTSGKRDGTEGVQFGFEDLDNHIKIGLPGEITVFAAMPGTGKTTVALQAALSQAKKGHPVVFFTIGDLNAEMIYFAAACLLTDLPKIDVLQGRITKESKEAMIHALEVTLPSLPLRVVDSSHINMNLASIVTKARAEVSAFKQQGLVMTPVLVFDYIQQLDTNSKSDNRASRLSDICKQIKSLTVSIKAHTIMLAQLPKEAARSGLLPKNQDLREGPIEQEAGTIVFVWNEKDPVTEAILSTFFYVTKHRMGAIINHIIPVTFLKDKGRYETTEDTRSSGWNMTRDEPSVAAILDNANFPKGKFNDEDLPF